MSSTKKIIAALGKLDIAGSPKNPLQDLDLYTDEHMLGEFDDSLKKKRMVNDAAIAHSTMNEEKQDYFAQEFKGNEEHDWLMDFDDKEFEKLLQNDEALWAEEEQRDQEYYARKKKEAEEDRDGDGVKDLEEDNGHIET
jgi:hypothetical protein